MGELVHLAEIPHEAGEGSVLGGGGEGRGLHDPEMMAQAGERRKQVELAKRLAHLLREVAGGRRSTSAGKAVTVDQEGDCVDGFEDRRLEAGAAAPATQTAAWRTRGPRPVPSPSILR